jgi:hypothetical protein
MRRLIAPEIPFVGEADGHSLKRGVGVEGERAAGRMRDVLIILPEWRIVETSDEWLELGRDGKSGQEEGARRKFSSLSKPDFNTVLSRTSIVLKSVIK